MVRVLHHLILHAKYELKCWKIALSSFWISGPFDGKSSCEQELEHSEDNQRTRMPMAQS